jgi:GNAT superfamily N-acetyltransferase
MKLSFTSPTEHPPGTVFRLLREAWSPVWNAGLERNIRQFDAEVAAHPETVGVCTFITCLGDEPIGMASYDPRQMPERGIVGWNCIVPKDQQKGFGKDQILEILRIFRERGSRKACVTTADVDFYVPAQRMYGACGFVRVRKTQDNNIEYELDLEELPNDSMCRTRTRGRRIGPGPNDGGQKKSRP